MELSGNDKRILWSSFFIAWTIIWIRAAAIPVFPDEVFSWFLYGESGQFFPPSAQIDANNHFANSILTWLSSKAFGVSALTIRLPNVLAFGPFFLSAVKISRYQRTKAGFYISLISIAGIFYVLEFFSLSRGYGISLAFLLLSVWQLMEFQKNLKTGTLCLLILSAIPALGSNLSLLFVYAALLAGVGAVVVYRRKEVSRLRLIAHLLLTIIFAVIFFVFYKYAAYLNELNMLYYGLTENFPFATTGSLLTEIFGKDLPVLYYLLPALLLLLFSGMIALILRGGIVSVFNNPRFVFPMLFLASVAGIAISVLVLDTPAPSDRTAVHLIPLFTGSLVFIFTSFDRKVFVSYLQLLVLIFPVATFWRMNLNNNHFWKSDQLSVVFYDKLEQEMKTAKKPLTVSGFRYFDRTYAFGYLLKNGAIPEYDFAAWQSGQADYLLLRPIDMVHPVAKNYSVIATDPVSGNCLLKRKEEMVKTKVDRVYVSAEAGEREFLEILRIHPDSLTSKGFVVDLRLQLTFEGSGERFIVTSAINDSTGKALRTIEHFRLNQLKSDWTTGENVNVTIPFHGIPDDAAEIILFIYNNKKVAHGNFRCMTTLYSISDLRENR